MMGSLEAINIVLVLDQNDKFVKYNVVNMTGDEVKGEEFETMTPAEENSNISCPVCFNEIKIFVYVNRCKSSKEVDTNLFPVKMKHQGPEMSQLIHQEFLIKNEQLGAENRSGRLSSKVTSEKTIEDKECTSFQCEICEKSFQKIRGLNRHKLFCSTSSNTQVTTDFTCEMCGEVFRNRICLQKHKEMTHGSDSVLKCRIEGCTTTCWSKLDLEQHELKHANPLSYICDICGKHYATRSIIMMHMKKYHDLSHTFIYCQLCKPPKRFVYQSQFKMHVNSIHSGIKKEKIHPCPLCDKRFTEAKSAAYHIRNIHEKKLPYYCELCGQGCATKYVYDDHVKKHKDPKPYSCDFCVKKFTSKHWVLKHMKVRHLGISEFVCQICGKKHETAGALEMHQLRHTKLKNKQCSHCSKAFLDQHSLKEHIKRKHMQSKANFACEKCDFVTTEAKYLKNHQLTHLNNAEKPFHCQYCTKGFGSMQNKERHELSHTNSRPVVCSVCGKSFRSKADSKDHYLREHSGEKPYVCGICQQAYADRGAYRNHMIGHEKQLGITLNKSIKKFIKKDRDFE